MTKATNDLFVTQTVFFFLFNDYCKLIGIVVLKYVQIVSLGILLIGILYRKIDGILYEQIIY